MVKRLFITFCLLIATFLQVSACSILYYIDQATGKIYVVNNEDYWYDVKPYINIIPAEKNKLARLWLGWNNVAQGGVNQAGLFFDVATSPEQPLPLVIQNLRVILAITYWPIVKCGRSLKLFRTK